MKATRLQKILAVMQSAFLLLTVAPIAVIAADAIEYVDAQGEAQTPITDYTVLENGVYRKTYQNAYNDNITGASVGTLEIDRSRLDRVEQTGISVEYAPFAFTSTGGDIKAVQGDTGHAQATMVTERYAHIMDDDRRLNAERFEEAFYGGKATEAADAGLAADGVSEEALALVKAIGNSPELMTLLKGLIKNQ